jgi:hypothetical protein
VALQRLEDLVDLFDEGDGLLADLLLLGELGLVVLAGVAVAVDVDPLVSGLQVPEVVLVRLQPPQFLVQVQSQFLAFAGLYPFDLRELPGLFEDLDGDGEVEEDVLLDVEDASEDLVVDQ